MSNWQKQATLTFEDSPLGGFRSRSLRKAPDFIKGTILHMRTLLFTVFIFISAGMSSACASKINNANLYFNQGVDANNYINELLQSLEARKKTIKRSTQCKKMRDVKRQVLISAASFRKATSLLASAIPSCKRGSGIQNRALRTLSKSKRSYKVQVESKREIDGWLASYCS